MFTKAHFNHVGQSLQMDTFAKWGLDIETYYEVWSLGGEISRPPSSPPIPLQPPHGPPRLSKSLENDTPLLVAYGHQWVEQWVAIFNLLLLIYFTHLFLTFSRECVLMCFFFFAWVKKIGNRKVFSKQWYAMRIF